MYQALYRKYRPVLFSDVCGQEHVTSVLKAQLQTGRVSHAYMFCGSRGTGKTSCAKILAKAVNCENPRNGEPCNECDTCRGINEERILDVVEMDAASNNGVDHIRRICDEVQFLPSEAKKRVYIIDEVHMLSTSAFNALLKTIEEPPAHVMFILATTEVNDIPVTIMSRCVRFDFKRITPEIIANRLLYVSQQENIQLEPDAALILAKLSDGAMRDALSLMEACRSEDGKIASDSVHKRLGLSGREEVVRLCRAISLQDVQSCLSIVRDMYEQMSDFKEVIGQLVSLYRDLLVLRTVADADSFLDGYENERPLLLEIAKNYSIETILYHAKELENFYVSYDRIATEKKASLEILMIRLCNEKLSDSREALLSRISKLEKGFVSAPKRANDEKERGAAVDSSAAIPVASSEKSREYKAVMEMSQEKGKRYSGALKLKNALQEEAFIKPWIAQMEFDKKENILFVFTGSFVRGMLTSTHADDIILKYASELDPDITSIVFDEKKAELTPKSSGLEEL